MRIFVNLLALYGAFVLMLSLLGAFGVGNFALIYKPQKFVCMDVDYD